MSKEKKVTRQHIHREMGSNSERSSRSTKKSKRNKSANKKQKAGKGKSKEEPAQQAPAQPAQAAQPAYAQPQAAAYGQQPQAAAYGQQPQAAAYGQQPQAAAYGQYPQAAAYAQQSQAAAAYGQHPQTAAYGQQAQATAAAYGQHPQTAAHVQPGQAAYGQQAQAAAYTQQYPAYAQQHAQTPGYPAQQAAPAQAAQPAQSTYRPAAPQQQYQQYQQAYAQQAQQAAQQPRPAATAYQVPIPQPQTHYQQPAAQQYQQPAAQQYQQPAGLPQTNRAVVPAAVPVPAAIPQVKLPVALPQTNRAAVPPIMMPQVQVAKAPQPQVPSYLPQTGRAAVPVQYSVPIPQPQQAAPQIPQPQVPQIPVPQQVQQPVQAQQPGQAQQQQPAENKSPSAAEQGGENAEEGQDGDESFQHNGTIVDYPKFNAEQDVQALRAAITGSCGERMIFDIFCTRSFTQRFSIVQLYYKLYNRSLQEDLESECKGSVRKLMLALLSPRYEFLSNQIMDSIKGGLLLDSDCLTDIVCTLDNAEMAELRNQYRNLFGKDILKDVYDHTSGSFRRIMVALLNGKRPSTPAEANTALDDARALKNAVGILTVDDDTFIRVFCGSSWDQLRATVQEYEKILGNRAEEAVESNFSGDSKKALLAIIQIMKDPLAFFASRLHKAVTGLVTNDKSVIRLVVTRSELDLALIRDVFKRMYSKPLEDALSGATSGGFRDSIVRLVIGNRQ